MDLQKPIEKLKNYLEQTQEYANSIIEDINEGRMTYEQFDRMIDSLDEPLE